VSSFLRSGSAETAVGSGTASITLRAYVGGHEHSGRNLPEGIPPRRDEPL
jgi:hypothetical protein